MKEESSSSSIVGYFRKETTSSPSISSTSAEIHWVWHTAFKSKSFNCENESAELFQAMFPDSAISKKFTGSRTKQSYLLNFAIGPYVRDQIAKSICQNPQPHYSVAFDEADGLMMIVIRYVHEGTVFSDMIDLPSLDGDYSSKNCLESIVSAIDNAKLPRRLCVSDFSDSCNAMRGRYS